MVYKITRVPLSTGQLFPEGAGSCHVPLDTRRDSWWLGGALLVALVGPGLSGPVGWFPLHWPMGVRMVGSSWSWRWASCPPRQAGLSHPGLRDETGPCSAWWGSRAGPTQTHPSLPPTAIPARTQRAVVSLPVGSPSGCTPHLLLLAAGPSGQWGQNFSPPPLPSLWRQSASWAAKAPELLNKQVRFSHTLDGTPG